MAIYFVSSSETVVTAEDGYIKFSQQNEVDGNTNYVWISVLQFEELCRQSKLLIEQASGTL